MDSQISLDLLWVYNENKPSGVIDGCSVGDAARFFKKNTVMEIVDVFSQRCGHVSRVF